VVKEGSAESGGEEVQTSGREKVGKMGVLKGGCREVEGGGVGTKGGRIRREEEA